MLFENHEWESPPAIAAAIGSAPATIRAAILRGDLEAIDIGTERRPTYRVHRDAWKAYTELKSTLDQLARRAREERKRGRIESVRELNH